MRGRMTPLKYPVCRGDPCCCRPSDYFHVSSPRPDSLSENMKNTFCHCERSEAISLINNQLERLPQGFQPFAMTFTDSLQRHGNEKYLTLFLKIL